MNSHLKETPKIFVLALYYEYDEPFPYDDRVVRLLNWVDGRDADDATVQLDAAPDLIMSYFDEPDHTGHNFGPDSEEIGEKLAELDNVLAALFDGLLARGLINCLNLIFVADHGMASISEEKTFYLNTAENSVNGWF